MNNNRSETEQWHRWKHHGCNNSFSISLLLCSIRFYSISFSGYYSNTIFPSYSDPTLLSFPFSIFSGYRMGPKLEQSLLSGMLIADFKPNLYIFYTFNIKPEIIKNHSKQINITKYRPLRIAPILYQNFCFKITKYEFTN